MNSGAGDAPLTGLDLNPTLDLKPESYPSSSSSSSSSLQTAVKQPLTRTQKILIGVFVPLAVLVVAALLLYFLWLHPKSSGDVGSKKFGSIQIRDLTSNVALTSGSGASVTFEPGDRLQLTYTASSSGFSGRAVWTLSVDGGKTFAVPVADPSHGNVVNWDIPETIFTRTAVFRVADADNATHYVDTTKTNIAIEPLAVLVTGPGLKRDRDAVVVGTGVSCSVQIDLALRGISDSTGAWRVETSADGQKFNAATVQPIVSVALDATLSVAQIVWNPSAEAVDVYYRVSTTALVANGYPYELSAVSPKPIEILAEVSCADVASTSAFTVCAVAATQNSSGHTRNFDSGAAVTLKFAYLNAFPGSATWSYSIGGAAFVGWTPVSGPDTSRAGIVSYQAVLPAGFTTNFVIRVVSGSQTMDSPTYTLTESFQILGISAGQTINVYPAPVLMSTVMQMSVSTGSIPTVWQVGVGFPAGTEWHPVVSVTPNSPKAGQATVVWWLTWSELGFTAAGLSKSMPLFFEATFSGGDAQQSVPVVFTSVIAPLQHAPVTLNSDRLCADSGKNLLVLGDPSGCSQTWYWDGSSTFGTVCVWSASSPLASDVCWGQAASTSPFQVVPGTLALDPSAYLIQSGGINTYQFFNKRSGYSVFTDEIQGVDALRVDPSGSKVGNYAWAAGPF